jgi:hypothetical protein
MGKCEREKEAWKDVLRWKRKESKTPMMMEKARETFRVFFGRGHCDGWPYALVCLLPDHIFVFPFTVPLCDAEWGNEAKQQHWPCHIVIAQQKHLMKYDNE